jgi:hypothetical protein
MAVTLPGIKKKISNFLLGEEGQISKKAAVGIGLALTGLAAQTIGAAHSSYTETKYDFSTSQLIGTHNSY